MQPVRTILLCAATAFSIASSEPSAAAEIDCGPQPTLACLAPHIFALARALPEGDDAPTPDGTWRKFALGFVEGLGTADLDLALRYFLDDNQHPSPWDDIEWTARAGHFDRAIADAEAADELTRRIGGLIAVCEQLVPAGQGARAAAILDRMEAELTGSDILDFTEYRLIAAARIWAGIGRLDRATRLLGHASIPHSFAVEAYLSLARSNPGQEAALRRQAWTLAERENHAYAWQLIAGDAADRGDVELVAAAATRAVSLPDPNVPTVAVGIARSLLKVGLVVQANRTMDRWRSWTAGKRESELASMVNAIVPMLVELGRDADVEAAVQMIPGNRPRSNASRLAADRLFDAGRTDVAKRLEAQTMGTVWSGPQSEYDAAYRSVARSRARRGDVQGALELIALIRKPSEASITLDIVARDAIDRGYPDNAAPAIERLASQARATSDANRLLKAAEYWIRAGRKESARTVVAEVLALWRDPGSGRPSIWHGTESITRWRDPGREKPNLWHAAYVIWQLDGTMPAIDAALGPFVVTPEDRATILRARLDAALQTSLGDAVRIAGEMPDPLKRLEALERIGRKLIETKPQ